MSTPEPKFPRSIATERLLLRRWRESDFEPLVKMNADPRVMELFPALLSRDESQAMWDRVHAHFDAHGFGFWAVEIPGIAPFAGILGLGIPRFEAHFTPCVEIGWRLLPEYWGNGYATEGAKATVQFAFQEIGLSEVVAMTSKINSRSRRVMEKLGMTYSEADDFDHPLVPQNHALTRTALYRLKADAPQLKASAQ